MKIIRTMLADIKGYQMINAVVELKDGSKSTKLISLSDAMLMVDDAFIADAQSLAKGIIGKVLPEE